MLHIHILSSCVERKTDTENAKPFINQNSKYSQFPDQHQLAMEYPTFASALEEGQMPTWKQSEAPDLVHEQRARKKMGKFLSTKVMASTNTVITGK